MEKPFIVSYLAHSFGIFYQILIPRVLRITEVLVDLGLANLDSHHLYYYIGLI